MRNKYEYRLEMDARSKAGAWGDQVRIKGMATHNISAGYINVEGRIIQDCGDSLYRMTEVICDLPIYSWQRIKLEEEPDYVTKTDEILLKMPEGFGPITLIKHGVV